MPRVASFILWSLIVWLSSRGFAQQVPPPPGVTTSQWYGVHSPYHHVARQVSVITTSKDTISGLLLGVFPERMAVLPDTYYPIGTPEELEPTWIAAEEVMLLQWRRGRSHLNGFLFGLGVGTVTASAIFAPSLWDLIGPGTILAGAVLGGFPSSLAGLAIAARVPHRVEPWVAPEQLGGWSVLSAEMKKHNLVPSQEVAARLPTYAPAHPSDPETWYSLYEAVPALEKAATVPKHTLSAYFVASP
ncbi:MAG TPA: hypothetical protein DCE41_27920, partial [Cytophagales bacterium]|nr:hypothetical protein [Cytophagales bacterium]